MLSFCVRFVTPLLIGGAENNIYGDDIALTGKALRGCWRFWFRALVGGCLQDCNPNVIADLENKVFGSTENSSFRLLVTEVPGTVHRKEEQLRLPHKSGGRAAPFYQAIAPGSTFRITIVPRELSRQSPETKKEADKKYEVLLLTIGTWAYLGGVGNRARRGFGSPVLCESKDQDDAFNKLISATAASKSPVPAIKESFSDSTELADHLRLVLKTVWKRFSQYVVTQGYTVDGDITANTKPKEERFFVLSSLDQISVGNRFNKLDEALLKVHGTGKCTSREEGSTDLGKSGRERWASPIFIRLHLMRDGTGRDQYIPLMTWCHQKNVSSSIVDLQDPNNSSNLRQFLREAHFEKTILGGDPYEF